MVPYYTVLIRFSRFTLAFQSPLEVSQFPENVIYQSKFQHDYGDVMTDPLFGSLTLRNCLNKCYHCELIHYKLHIVVLNLSIVSHPTISLA